MIQGRFNRLSRVMTNHNPLYDADILFLFRFLFSAMLQSPSVHKCTPAAMSVIHFFTLLLSFFFPQSDEFGRTCCAADIRNIMVLDYESVPADEEELPLDANDALYRILRSRLQFFLFNCTPERQAQRVSLLPQSYLHERATLLGSAGSHDVALRLYCHELRSLTLAEAYCRRVWGSFLASVERHGGVIAFEDDHPEDDDSG